MYLIILILVLTAIDQLSKLYMYNMSGGEIGYSIPIINDFFHLTYIENHGGIFGVFQGKINYFTIISIVLIFSLVLFLDFYISLFLIICFLLFVSYARKVAFDSLKKEYQIIFQTFGNICFYLTFILIIALYFSGVKIVLINILLAFMLSRLYFRSLSSFSINLISIHKELKKQ